MDDLSKYFCWNKGCSEYGIRGGENISVRALYGKHKDMPNGATALYQWYRGTTSNGTWTAITANSSANANYTPTTADIGYFLRVVATGTGNHTGTVERILTNAVPTIPLSAPTLGDVTAASSSTISVEWSTVPDASGYKVEYRMGTEWWREAGATGNP